MLWVVGRGTRPCPGWMACDVTCVIGGWSRVTPMLHVFETGVTYVISFEKDVQKRTEKTKNIPFNTEKYLSIPKIPNTYFNTALIPLQYHLNTILMPLQYYFNTASIPQNTSNIAFNTAKNHTEKLNITQYRNIPLQYHTKIPQVPQIPHNTGVSCFLTPMLQQLGDG